MSFLQPRQGRVHSPQAMARLAQRNFRRVLNWDQLYQRPSQIHPSFPAGSQPGAQTFGLCLDMQRGNMRGLTTSARQIYRQQRRAINHFENGNEQRALNSGTQSIQEQSISDGNSSALQQANSTTTLEGNEENHQDFKRAFERNILDNSSEMTMSIVAEQMSDTENNTARGMSITTDEDEDISNLDVDLDDLMPVNLDNNIIFGDSEGSESSIETQFFGLGASSEDETTATRSTTDGDNDDLPNLEVDLDDLMPIKADEIGMLGDSDGSASSIEMQFFGPEANLGGGSEDGTTTTTDDDEDLSNIDVDLDDLIEIDDDIVETIVSLGLEINEEAENPISRDDNNNNLLFGVQNNTGMGIGSIATANNLINRNYRHRIPYEQWNKENIALRTEPARNAQASREMIGMLEEDDLIRES
jgi:hypothetical protein